MALELVLDRIVRVLLLIKNHSDKYLRLSFASIEIIDATRYRYSSCLTVNTNTRAVEPENYSNTRHRPQIVER